MKNPLIAAVLPLAKQYITAENISKVFCTMTGNFPVGVDEKPVILVSKDAQGKVMAGVYSIDSHNRITSMYSRAAVEDLLKELLN